MSANDTETARLQLEEVWRQLEPIIAEAKALQEDVARSPSLAGEPWFEVHLRWLTVFGREIDAVQTVYDSVTSGARLSGREIETAHDAGGKLLEVIEKARSLSPQPA